MKVTQLCPTLCDAMDYNPWNSPGQNAGIGSLSLLQGIFPIQALNPGLPHCRWIPYQLRHKGSPIERLFAIAKSLQSCLTLCDSIDGSPPGSPPWDSLGKNTGVGCHFFLQCVKAKGESEVTQSCPT